jgi:hypothetical protein
VSIPPRRTAPTVLRRCSCSAEAIPATVSIRRHCLTLGGRTAML